MNQFKIPRMNAILVELWLQQQGYKTAGYTIDGNNITVLIEDGPQENKKRPPGLTTERPDA